MVFRVLLILTLFSLPQHVRIAFAELPVVHAVLFYSPTCGHCHYVITEVLPPLFEQYGDQLRIVGVNTADSEGQRLYQAAYERFRIPDERRGVPTLILDETVLVGSGEIPEQLPILIAQYLAEGGVDWPDIPGLAEVLQISQPTTEATPEATSRQGAATAPNSNPPAQLDSDSNATRNDMLVPDSLASDDIISKFQRDPAGNTLSVLLLTGMVIVVGHVLSRMRQVWKEKAMIIALASDPKGWRSLAVPLLCLIGLGVSIYLAYVEMTHTTAVCGPVGDCNTVQQSDYAMLLGLIPIGVLGVVGYAAMLIVWIGTQWGRGQIRAFSAAALLGMALVGTLFSIYLTFLEPFVIGATCAWCLTSALSMTLILLVLAGSMPVYMKMVSQESHAYDVF